MRFSLLVACLSLATSPLWGKIVFYSQRDGNSEIYTMDADGSNPTRLTFNEARDTSPAWSSNGQQIAFHSYRDGNREVYVMDADGSNPQNLTRHPAFDGRPDWSPDGSRIAFTRGIDNGAINIHVMNADGSNVQQLTHMRIEHWELASKPKWSPDGEWILFGGDIVEGNLKQGRQVYAMRPDGSDRWQVSVPAFNAAMFLGGWSPDGKQILYAEAIESRSDKSTPVIATLDLVRRVVIRWQRVPVPKGPFDTSDFSADGKSILFAGKQNDDDWNIYRFVLADRQLIQLTNSPGRDAGPHEWNPRLSVSPQELAPKRWGEIKSNSHNQRGIGDISIPPIP